jgi:phenylacetate-CoA ligase
VSSVFPPFFYKKIIYPIYQLKHGIHAGNEIIRKMGIMDKMQWQPQTEIAAYQYGKLRKLIEHIYRNVPYYQKIMKKHGITPDDIACIEDIRRIPVLTKTQIRENRAELKAIDIGTRKVVEAATGGSTGEPFSFIRDWETLSWTEAGKLRGMSWANCRIENVLIDYNSDSKPSWLGAVRGRLINNYYFPAIAKEDEIVKQMQEIRSLSPFCLAGYASNLYRIAAICHKHAIDNVEIPAIFSTGEMLYDYQRKFIEDQFRGKVFDYYGCNEVGSIAYECEYHRKHITEERFIFETTDSGGTPCPGRMGDITITDLDNYAMPFIRYKNGDAGTLSDSQCKCGRALRTIDSLYGRTQDFLKTIDGNYVPGVFFPNRFKDLKGIDQYQIIQMDVNHIVLKIVKNKLFNTDELADMVGVIKTMIGDGLRLDIEEEKNIPLTREGKTRPVISHVPAELY